MDPVTAQLAKPFPAKGIRPGDVVSGVLAGLICGVLAVFVVAWSQGGITAFDPDSFIDSVLAVLRRFYPH
jgi:hypothetical protein